MQKERNRLIDNGWIFERLTDYSIIKNFDCGNNDLNDYFHNDVLNHRKELLTKTYIFCEEDHQDIPVALVDLCNDSVRREKLNIFNIFSEEKRYPDYPAVKITRLGVESDFQKNGVGTYLISSLKKLFLINNRTGCRFITVDAYSNDLTLKFYQKNDFIFFNDKSKNKKTRPMFFDLLSIEQ